MGRGSRSLHQMKLRVYGGTKDISAARTQPRETASCNYETRKQFRVLLGLLMTVQVHGNDGIKGVEENGLGP